MNLLDGFILLMLVFPAIRGYQRGLAASVIGLIGFAFALYLAVRNFHKFGTMLSDWFRISEHAAPYVAFFVIFIGLIMLTNFISRAVTHAFDEVAVGTVNRIFGSAFTIFTALVFISIAFLFFAKIDLPPEEVCHESMLYARIEPLAPIVFDKVVSHFPESKKFYDELSSLISKASGGINFDDDDKKYPDHDEDRDDDDDDKPDSDSTTVKTK